MHGNSPLSLYAIVAKFWDHFTVLTAYSHKGLLQPSPPSGHPTNCRPSPCPVGGVETKHWINLYLVEQWNRFLLLLFLLLISFKCEQMTKSVQYKILFVYAIIGVNVRWCSSKQLSNYSRTSKIKSCIFTPVQICTIKGENTN